MSDLHLEFGALQKPLPCGEVLVLAGDICVAKYLNPRMNDADSRSIRKNSFRLFDEAVRNFDRVLYIAGNHEYYGGEFSETQDVLIETADKLGITFLENGISEIDGVTFICATLWSDMNGEDPVTMFRVGRGMNDFWLIKKEDRAFRPEDAVEEFKNSVGFIEKALRTLGSKPAIVVTHHAPSYRGIGERHAGNTDINGGYACDLHGLIEDHPNISYWIFGHTHIQKQFEIGATTVVSNARGYFGYEESAAVFDPDTSFEIEISASYVEGTEA